MIRNEGDRIARSFVAKNFVAAMEFLNQVARVAEEQGHHPDIHLTQYRNVEIQLQTHSMGGTSTHDSASVGLAKELLRSTVCCITIEFETKLYP